MVKKFNVHPIVALIALGGGIALATGGTGANTADCLKCVGPGGAGATCIPAVPPTNNNEILKCITCVSDLCGADCTNIPSIQTSCGQ